MLSNIYHCTIWGWLHYLFSKRRNVQKWNLSALLIDANYCLLKILILYYNNVTNWNSFFNEPRKSLLLRTNESNCWIVEMKNEVTPILQKNIRLKYQVLIIKYNLAELVPSKYEFIQVWLSNYIKDCYQLLYSCFVLKPLSAISSIIQTIQEISFKRHLRHSPC